MPRIPGEIISCYNDPVQYKVNLFLSLQQADPDDIEQEEEGATNQSLMDSDASSVLLKKPDDKKR